MKKFELAKVQGGMKRFGFRLKKRSPEILIVAGVVGVVTSAVMACKATTKIGDILEESKTQMDAIRKYSDDADMAEKYTPEDAKKDTAVVYIQTGVKLVKLYAPAVTLGMLSLVGILASNNILRQRYTAVAAAYSAVDRGFKEYRSRVVERFGERVDHELKHNIKAVEIEETTTDEKGKEKKVKKTIDVVDDGPDGYSPYAKFFDETSRCWEKDSDYNLMFLKSQQQYANDKLKANGFLFLNEVYEALDIPKTKAGQIVGWVYDPDNPEHNGDNYVDFGIMDVNRPKNRDFVNGYERAILLDFNVDGNILDLMV